MSSLTETAFYTRKVVNYSVIGIVCFFILRALFGYAIETWKRLNPPPPPPPTVAFGKLPALQFPSSSIDRKKINFALETIEGKTPTASSSGTVYFIAKPAANLLGLTRATNLANRLDFKGEPQQLNPQTYRWQDISNPFRSFEFDIVTNNFKLLYDYALDLAVFNEKGLPDKEKAVSEAKTFLQNLGLISLVNSPAFVSFWQLSGNSLIKTTSLSTTDAVRVDLGRENINGLKVFSSAYPNELTHFLFSGNTDTQRRILEAVYVYWPIDLMQSATYPLKTSQQAFEELKNNGGYVVNFTESEKTIIRQVYLAYFYPDSYQPYLQPIFVFEGDGNFLAFVPAVSPSWTSQ